MFKLLKNARILNEAMELVDGQILIQDDIIYDILQPDEEPRKNVEACMDLHGQTVFPGLINPHDHLVETCWTTVNNEPSDNWYEWESKARQSKDWKDMQKLSVTDLYTLGMYKNILSGVTTVVDHFPPEISNTFANHSLTSILQHYYLSHSVSNQKHNWGRNTVDEFRQARGVLPFIIHIAQGNSSEQKEELEILNRTGALESNTVLVGGNFLSENDLKLISIKKSPLIWLPTFSETVLNKHPDMAKVLEMEIPFAIGTDSTMTGSTNLLQEMRKALEYSVSNLNGKIKAKDLVKMNTSGAAHFFGIEKVTGTISPGKEANLIAFNLSPDKDAFETFLKCQPEDFSMVMHKGILIVGNDEYRSATSLDFSLYSEILLNGTAKILFGKPLQLLDRINHKIGELKEFNFFKVTGES